MFENREKEKEEIYIKSLKGRIKTKCCKVDFEKDEYMKELIKTNQSEDAIRSKYEKTWIKCICNEFLVKHDLLEYFSKEEVDSIFAKITVQKEEEKNLSKEILSCSSCKKKLKIQKMNTVVIVGLFFILAVFKIQA